MKQHIAACLAGMLLLTGCAEKRREPQQTGTSAPVTAAAEPRTTESETTEAEPEFVLPAMNAPLEPLSCAETEGTVTAAVCRGTAVAVQCVSGQEHRYEIFDSCENRRIRSGRLQTADEQLVGLTESGEAVTIGLRSGDFDGTVRRYGSAEEPRTVQGSPLTKAVYDAATDRVIGYSSDENALIQTDSSGQQTVFLRLTPRMQYLGGSADRRVLTVTEPSDNPAVPCNAAAYSMDSGIRLGRTAHIDGTQYAFSGGYMLREYLDYDSDTGFSAFEVRTSRFMDKNLYAGFKTDDRGQDRVFDYVTDNASPYALGTEQSGGMVSALVFADFRAGTRAVQPFADGKQASAVQFCFSRETGRWLTAAAFPENGRTVTRLMLTEPQLAEQTETFLPAASLSQEPEQKQAAVYLEGAHGLAERIGAKYGIRILIGDEVLNVREPGVSWDSVQTEEQGMTGEEIAAETVITLKQLDARLAAYSRNFFQHFQDEYGEGGLMILLADHITTDSIGAAGGAQILCGKWYGVVLERNGAENIHHELWHAVEARICASEPEAFSDEPDAPWQALLPEGFSYTHYAESYRSLPGSWFLTEAAQPQDAYFAGRYACADSREDRAVLIEWFFRGCDSYGLLGEERKLNWELLPQLPHLRAKADYMAEQTKKVFGSAYWEEIMQNGYDYDAVLAQTFTPYP